MTMGFILPFALMLVAIPLESFVHSLRTVIGMFGVFLLKVLAFMIRQVGSLSSNLGHVLLNIYDLIIYLVLSFVEIIISNLADFKFIFKLLKLKINPFKFFCLFLK